GRTYASLWHRLARWKRPQPGSPRALLELGVTYPRSTIWIIASEVYLHAIADDVRRLAAALNNIDRLCIFSAGTENLAGLTDYLIPCDARLQPVVGGARRSLNIRLARKALRELGKKGPGLRARREKFTRLLARPGPRVAWY